MILAFCKLVSNEHMYAFYWNNADQIFQGKTKSNFEIFAKNWQEKGVNYQNSVWIKQNETLLKNKVKKNYRKQWNYYII